MYKGEASKLAKFERRLAQNGIVPPWTGCDEHGETALMYACYAIDVDHDMIEFILGFDAESQVRKVDKSNRNALMHLMYMGDIVAARLLLAHSPGVQLAQKDYFMENALMMTCLLGHHGKAEFLLSFEDHVGEQIRSLSKSGRNAMMMACQSNSVDIVHLLSRKGDPIPQFTTIDVHGTNALTISNYDRGSGPCADHVSAVFKDLAQTRLIPSRLIDACGSMGKPGRVEDDLIVSMSRDPTSEWIRRKGLNDAIRSFDINVSLEIEFQIVSLASRVTSA
jgi:hypothetical protein